MSKIEKLLNITVKEETDATNGASLSLSVYLVIICSVIISLGLFFGLLYVVDVDGYLQNNSQIINLYNFYDQKVGENGTAVYLLGSCAVGCPIYPPEVNRLIKMYYPNITVYNLYLANDIPLGRSVQLKNIIDSKPSLIIYGLMPRDIGAYYWDNDNFVLVHERLSLMDDSSYLYSKEQIMSISRKENIGYYKKFIQNAFRYKYSSGKNPYFALNYSYDPLGEEYRKYLSSKIDINQTIENINNPNSKYRRESEVSAEWTQNKEALMYIVKKFKENDVPVIIVNMPINPLLSEQISNSSYSNYFSLINETNVTHYDLDGFGSPDDFFDEIHMTYDGALKFAPRMADLIIEQVEKDVIHYT